MASRNVAQSGVDLTWGARPLNEQLPATLSRIHVVSFQADLDAIYNLHIARLISNTEAANALRRLAKKIDAEVNRAPK